MSEFAAHLRRACNRLRLQEPSEATDDSALFDVPDRVYVNHFVHLIEELKSVFPRVGAAADASTMRVRVVREAPPVRDSFARMVAAVFVADPAEPVRDAVARLARETESELCVAIQRDLAPVISAHWLDSAATAVCDSRTSIRIRGIVRLDLRVLAPLVMNNRVWVVLHNDQSLVVRKTRV
jgi:hypothetical protein